MDISWGDNGPGWVVVLMRDADAVLSVRPDWSSFGGPRHRRRRAVPARLGVRRRGARLLPEHRGRRGPGHRQPQRQHRPVAGGRPSPHVVRREPGHRARPAPAASTSRRTATPSGSAATRQRRSRGPSVSATSVEACSRHPRSWTVSSRCSTPRTPGRPSICARSSTTTAGCRRRDIAALLTGMKVISAATVTAQGEPRISAMDGHFLHGTWTFSTSRTSAKARHLARRPAVSIAHVDGEALAVFSHGHVVELAGDELAAVDAHWTVSLRLVPAVVGRRRDVAARADLDGRLRVPACRPAGRTRRPRLSSCRSTSISSSASSTTGSRSPTAPAPARSACSATRCGST